MIREDHSHRAQICCCIAQRLRIRVTQASTQSFSLQNRLSLPLQPEYSNLEQRRLL